MPKRRIDYACKSFYYTGAKIYNKLHLKIRKIINAPESDKSLKDYFVKSNALKSSINRW